MFPPSKVEVISDFFVETVVLIRLKTHQRPVTAQENDKKQTAYVRKEGSFFDFHGVVIEIIGIVETYNISCCCIRDKTCYKKPLIQNFSVK